MSIPTAILGILCLFSVFMTVRILLSARQRWNDGLFKIARTTALISVAYLALVGFTGWGFYAGIQVSSGYDRAGADNVKLLGAYDGFEDPLVAYTDRETGKLCIGERVGGEEFLVEVECIETQPEENEG